MADHPDHLLIVGADPRMSPNNNILYIQRQLCRRQRPVTDYATPKSQILLRIVLLREEMSDPLLKRRNG